MDVGFRMKGSGFGDELSLECGGFRDGGLLVRVSTILGLERCVVRAARDWEIQGQKHAAHMLQECALASSHPG